MREIVASSHSGITLDNGCTRLTALLQMQRAESFEGVATPDDIYTPFPGRMGLSQPLKRNRTASSALRTEGLAARALHALHALIM